VRGLYTLTLVLLFLLAITTALVRYGMIEKANKAAIWYIRTKTYEYTRRDYELSLRRALHYAATSCHPPTNQCVESSARRWIRRLNRAWGAVGISLQINPETVRAHVLASEAVYIIRVYLSSPVDGNIGNVVVHIPTGFGVTEVVPV